MQTLTLFISDLHLQAEQPQLTRIFFHFLKILAPQAEKLYILGDFFEYWIGDDDSNPFITNIKDNLRALVQQGTQVFLMPGNRDFLLGKNFAQETGCILLPDPCLIDLYGIPTLLVHGDSLCSQDVKHQYFRNISQHKLTKRLFLSIPLSMRKAIAQRIRQISKNKTGKLSAYQMDVWPETVIKTMRTWQVNQLIHGHTHQPAHHDFTLESQPASRIVLGAWHHQGNALLCQPHTKPRLINFGIEDTCFPRQ